ncbi:MAG: TetR/AcrR family transcriptional regulator [Proteobacteria bacterium]|nr:TetR/AcrR family transcriptional regulator [Pseudomonadota bacterium]
MSPRKRQPGQRTQAERSAETRDKVIRATMDCLAERGYAATTVASIVRRSGVTWGAIQHQYPDKLAIFDAVMEAALGEFESTLVASPEADTPLAERVAEFVGRCRRAMEHSAWPAFLEIQLHQRDRPRGWGSAAEETLSRIFDSVFGDLALPEMRLETALAHTSATLRGITLHALTHPDTTAMEVQLDVLCQVLIAILDGTLPRVSR